VHRTVTTDSHQKPAAIVNGFARQLYGMANALGILELKRQTNVVQQTADFGPLAVGSIGTSHRVNYYFSLCY
jgi:hypothetical protein